MVTCNHHLTTTPPPAQSTFHTSRPCPVRLHLRPRCPLTPHPHLPPSPYLRPPSLPHPHLYPLMYAADLSSSPSLLPSRCPLLSEEAESAQHNLLCACPLRPHLSLYIRQCLGVLGIKLQEKSYSRSLLHYLLGRPKAIRFVGDLEPLLHPLLVHFTPCPPV
jgi:hypothetical protein